METHTFTDLKNESEEMEKEHMLLTRLLRGGGCYQLCQLLWLTDRGRVKKEPSVLPRWNWLITASGNGSTKAWLKWHGEWEVRRWCQEPQTTHSRSLNTWQLKGDIKLRHFFITKTVQSSHRPFPIFLLCSYLIHSIYQN